MNKASPAKKQKSKNQRQFKFEVDKPIIINQRFKIMKFNTKNIVGWEKDGGKILCPECFKRIFSNDYQPDWEPVLFGNDGNILYECDIGCCRTQFTN